MTDPDLLDLFIAPLETLVVPYMITGGVASVIYGDPRFTRDVDIVLALTAERVGELASAFPSDRFYVPPAEVIGEEVARAGGGHFNVIHHQTALRADVYLAGDDPLHAWAFGRRMRVQSGGLTVWVAPIEYVVVRKLEYFRMAHYDRHIRDVAMMLRISADAIDGPDLERWVEERGLRAELDAARNYPDE